MKKTSILHPKANKGIITLKGYPDWEERLPMLVFSALQIMVQRLSSDHNSTIGSTKYTEVSMAIGKFVIGTMSPIDLSPHKKLAVGDLFIGGFYQGGKGYVDIYRDTSYAAWNGSEPYILAVNDRFHELGVMPPLCPKELLGSTSSSPIPPVTEMVQEHGRSVIKTSDDRHTQHLLLSVQEQLPWIRSLDKLQSQGWMINEKVLKGVVAGISNFTHIVKPRPNKGSPIKVRTAFEALKKRDTKATRTKFNTETMLWNMELEVLKAQSKNVETGVIMKKAEALLDMGVFYQYVELDYRGRAYYQEPFMNFQGADLARGMFLFSEGKRITDTKWLAIHTANTFNESFDKGHFPHWCLHDYDTILDESGLDSFPVDRMAMEDKERWCVHNLQMIRDTASSGAIRSCDKPVSFLACCHEWVGYLEDPLGYLSHLPIPIDGSCNGYQHSAAISQDAVTGQLVSLTDQPIQSDLYTVAAQKLKEKMPAFFAARPLMKMHHIRKGITKRAVMTRAYSAGKSRISDAMYRDCHSEGYTTLFNISMLDCIELGSALYDLIGDICPGATETMKYLQTLAEFELGKYKVFDTQGNPVSPTDKRHLHARKQQLKKRAELSDKELDELRSISSTLLSYKNVCVRGNGVNPFITWETPTGFQVIYEAYRTSSLKVLSTIPGCSLQSGIGTSRVPGRITHVLQMPTSYPDIRKFQSGISPNFIHSMDSSHMAGIAHVWEGAFGAVHDSFSTHIADVEDLLSITKEVFVDIYDVEDPHAEIANMILQGDATIDFPLPERGSLNIQEVLTSRYFFS